MLRTQGPLSGWIYFECHLESLSGGDVNVCRHHNQADGFLSFNELFNDIFYLLQENNIIIVERIDFFMNNFFFDTHLHVLKMAQSNLYIYLKFL